MYVTISVTNLQVLIMTQIFCVKNCIEYHVHFLIIFSYLFYSTHTHDLQTSPTQLKNSN
jgi:hypothetical protein